MQSNCECRCPKKIKRTIIHFPFVDGKQGRRACSIQANVKSDRMMLLYTTRAYKYDRRKYSFSMHAINENH